MASSNEYFFLPKQKTYYDHTLCSVRHEFFWVDGFNWLTKRMDSWNFEFNWLSGSLKRAVFPPRIKLTSPKHKTCWAQTFCRIRANFIWVDGCNWLTKRTEPWNFELIWLSGKLKQAVFPPRLKITCPKHKTCWDHTFWTIRPDFIWVNGFNWMTKRMESWKFELNWLSG